MEETGFQITESITKRLKGVMIAIAVFFLVSAAAIFISSLNFLTGLQKINSANNILTLITHSIEAIDTSNQNIDKLENARGVNDIRFAFKESQKLLKAKLEESIRLSEEYPKVRKQLLLSLDSVHLYETSVDNLFKMYQKLPAKKSFSQRVELNAEIVTASQFAMDSRDFLRKAQISLRENSDSVFNSIFEDRFQPLLVGITLSALFFLFVVTFGLSVSRRINSSVRNLKSAAESVMTGNLSYYAPVLARDEFGLLTNSFNSMLKSLREGQEALGVTINRLRRLQEITEGYSESLTVEEVIEVTLGEGFEALESSVGAIALLSEDGNFIEVKKFVGYHADTERMWSRFPAKLVTPLADAIRKKEPFFIGTEEELNTLYPHIDEWRRNNIKALAVIPLIVNNVGIGALSFAFKFERKFQEGDKAFKMAIGRQCSQALHRARLFDESKKAIQLRDDFLSIASHELKTPLTPLKLQMQLIERQIRSGSEINTEKLNQLIINSDKQINRLSKLIEDLLDVSRISSGKFNLEIKRVNFSRLIDEVLVQYGGQLKDSLTEINVNLDRSIEGECDALRIEQVIINLLTNAAKYAPHKPVDISLSRQGNMARLSIKDYGKGISKKDQGRIFRRFERVKNTESISGLGLGLFISKQIVEAHKGSIFVESEEDQGSEFIIELPLSK